MSIRTEIQISQDGAGLSLRVNHGYVGHTLESETVRAIDAMGVDIRSRRLDVDVIGPAIWSNIPPAVDVIANAIRAELTRMERTPYVGTLTGPDTVRLQGAVYGGMTRVRANASHRAIKALVRMGATLRVTEFDTGAMHGPTIESASLCDCSEDFGPCEDHSTVLVVREGASTRTADESALQLVEDLRDCGVKLADDDSAEFDRLTSALEDSRDAHSGVAWFDVDSDRDSARELADRIEQSADGLWVSHDDGYVIARPHDDCPLVEPAPTSITAEIGTTGNSEAVQLTGDVGADISTAVGLEHADACDSDCCDIDRATDDGYPFWGANLLQSATECPLLDAVIAHYCEAGAITDWQELASKDCDAWSASETWTHHAFKCDSCESFTFSDDGTPSQCGNCLGEHFTPHALDGFDVDGFVAGYLDAILFTESVGSQSEDEEWNDTSLLSHGCSRDDFTESAVAELRTDCVDFLIGNIADVREYCELRGDPVRCSSDSFGRTEYSAAETAGSDFWLSRNGHGAGFFDRGNEAVFARLQEAASVYGEEIAT